MDLLHRYGKTSEGQKCELLPLNYNYLHFGCSPEIRGDREKLRNLLWGARALGVKRRIAEMQIAKNCQKL